MIGSNETQYLNLANRILKTGERMEQRAVLASTGERPYCLSLFGEQIRLDLSRGFPLLTTKKMSINAVVAELVWFISGSTNAKDLENMGARIWSNWADDNGELGSVYGKNWRRWCGVARDANGIEHVAHVDQLRNLEDGIKAVIADPNHSLGRRLLMVNYNPGDLPPKAPPGCHTVSQYSVRKGRLDCHVYARSIDTFLGLPYNMASYAAFTTAMANVHDLKPGYLVFSFGDVHIYSNHITQITEQLNRLPRSQPELAIVRKLPSIVDLTVADVELRGYDPHPFLPGEVAI